MKGGGLKTNVIAEDTSTTLSRTSHVLMLVASQQMKERPKRFSELYVGLQEGS